MRGEKRGEKEKEKGRKKECDEPFPLHGCTLVHVRRGNTACTLSFKGFLPS